MPLTPNRMRHPCRRRDRLWVRFSLRERGFLPQPLGHPRTQVEGPITPLNTASSFEIQLAFVTIRNTYASPPAKLTANRHFTLSRPSGGRPAAARRGARRQHAGCGNCSCWPRRFWRWWGRRWPAPTATTTVRAPCRPSPRWRLLCPHSHHPLSYSTVPAGGTVLPLSPAAADSLSLPTALPP